MLLHSIEIHNFKSIGESNNLIIIEPRITTIIGKNESGKSNILEALSKISFTKNSSTFFKEDVMNKQCLSVDNMKIVACLKWSDNEKTIFENEEESFIEISKNSYIVSGGLRVYFDMKCKPIIEELDELLKTNPYKYTSTNLDTFRNKRTSLINATMNIPAILDSVEYFKKCNDNCNLEIKNDIALTLNSLDALLMKITAVLPVFHYRNSDKILKSKYTIDDLKGTTASTDLVNDFLKVIGYKKSDLIEAISQGTSAVNVTRRGNIRKAIHNNINKLFNKYYEAGDLNLNLDYGSNNVTFTLETSEGVVVSLSERSNGIKWYLNHFIDVQANQLNGRNVVYLLDEPGVFLHINAQKKILELFENLVDKGNQVIYTTHLPSMIETNRNGLHRIRAVEKNENEYTLIFKTAHDRNISNKNYQDTITPVLKAIGMDMTYSLLPSAEKLNIIVEGSSDYIFLKSLAKRIKIDLSEFNIIPARGVNNIVNISSILTGWGCPNMAIFDYDNEGVVCGAFEMDKISTDDNKKYLFLREISDEEINHKTYNTSRYMIEDFVGQDFISKFVEGNSNLDDKTSKTLVAKLICNDIDEGIIDIPEETQTNTIDLFNRIKSLNK